MTDQARQDERMIEWLADGPWDPPSEVLEAAVAHARSHPRRAHRIGGLRRSLMSGIHLTPVQQRPAGHRTAFAVLAAATATIVVAAGLVGGMNLVNGPSTVVGPGATGLPTPLASNPPTSPVKVEGAFSGCRFTSRGGEKVVGALTQMRGRAYVCDFTSPDPRLDGTAAITYNYDNLADGDEQWGSADAWGTLRLETADGSWDGMWGGDVGPYGYAIRHRMSGVLIGAGGHDGLRVRWTMHGFGNPQGPGLAFSPGSDWTFTAVLETVDTMPRNGTTLVSGAAGCSEVESGTQTDADGVTQVRGAVIECSSSGGSDPRLEGINRTVINIDLQADDSADMWGTEEITVDGELRWRGEASGTVAVGYTTHRLEGIDIGYGPYAGLEYRWTTIGDPDWGYVTRGRIVSASSD